MRKSLKCLLVDRLEKLDIKSFSRAKDVKDGIGLVSSKFIYGDRVVLINKKKGCRAIRDLTREETKLLYDMLETVMEEHQRYNDAIKKLNEAFLETVNSVFYEFGSKIEVIVEE